MLSFSNNALSTSFMTKNDIMGVCPMALRKSPTNTKVSERYVFADTEMVIDDLEKCGWRPVEAKQVRARKTNDEGVQVRSFHMIAFQNPEVFISRVDEGGNEVVDCYPRIILTNSHDGFNSFRFMVGLFRLVCSNGLIVATEQFADIHIRHVSYTFEELRGVINTAMAQVNEQVAAMNAMSKVMLTQEQKESLASEAIRIRQNKPEEQAVYIDPETIAEVLEPLRKEDEGNSLWNVFNVLQEHLMRGSYRSRASQTAKSRKARPLTSVSRAIDFNMAFFRAAHRYATIDA